MLTGSLTVHASDPDRLGGYGPAAAIADARDWRVSACPFDTIPPSCRLNLGGVTPTLVFIAQRERWAFGVIGASLSA